MLLTNAPSEINNLFNYNWAYVFVGIFVLLIAIKYTFDTVDWFIKKLGIESKNKNKTDEYRTKVNEQSDAIEKLLDSNCNIEQKLNTIQSSVEFLENDAIIAKNADIELLYDRISQKARYYQNTLKGIPEDEVDNFIRLFDVYTSRGGNHGLKVKVDNCLSSLPILPMIPQTQTKKD